MTVSDCKISCILLKKKIKFSYSKNDNCYVRKIFGGAYEDKRFLFFGGF